jgi:hypothetical protein
MGGDGRLVEQREELLALAEDRLQGKHGAVRWAVGQGYGRIVTVSFRGGGLGRTSPTCAGAGSSTGHAL